MPLFKVRVAGIYDDGLDATLAVGIVFARGVLCALLFAVVRVAGLTLCGVVLEDLLFLVVVDYGRLVNSVPFQVVDAGHSFSR